MARSDSDRPGFRQLYITVPQRGDGAIPEVLHRFQRAVLGFGRIDPPNDEGIYVWRPRGFVEAQATIALIWRFIGPVKRAQAAAAMWIVNDQYRSGRFASRAPRHRPVADFTQHTASLEVMDVGELERAWAAGFLDAEGCFGLVRCAKRRRGPDWYRIRASASQNGEPGVPAAVLRRLHRVLAIGRIEVHGDPDDFRWCAEGAERVEQVLAIVDLWLGAVKRDQARNALARFRAQVRLKGEGTVCVRGHTYDRVAPTGTRGMRKFCNSCGRLLARRARAARGIAPRQFKNVARRYHL